VTAPGERRSEQGGYLRDGPDLTGPELHQRLEQTWGDAPGLWGWITTVDHKRIGRRYLVTALIFLALGGLLAALMRIQLSGANRDFLDPDRFNQIFTMHGTTMMFLFAVPVMDAFAIYLVPLMLGARSIAFPRLNAFSYWMYLFGGILLWVAFVLKVGARCRLVLVRAARRSRVLARQAGRHLGADGHLHRNRRAVGRGGHHRDDPQDARPRHALGDGCRCSSGRCWWSR
jgi:hypothetical protein